MSNSELDSSKPGLPYGPRHQIQRSISELSSPIKLHRHHHHRKDRQADDRLPQSENHVPQPRGSLEMPRSEGITPNMTPNQSRRASVFGVTNEDGRTLLTPQSAAERTADKEEAYEDGDRAASKAASRAAGLKKSLVDLSTFSTKATRRLDDTYYAVLEKMSVLQSTIVAMKELAIMARATNENFAKESEELVRDIQRQVDSVGQFDEQENKIKLLQSRIYQGRTRIQELSERVDIVRERVEGWERADKEWQERTRKRLKVIWIIMSVIFFAMILLFLSAQYVAPIVEETTGMDSILDAVSGLVAESGMGNVSTSTMSSLGLKEPDKEDAFVPPLQSKDGVMEDERLRLFDEL